MVGRNGVLMIGEYLFVEFFSWTEACVNHLDVLVRDKAGKADHTAGEIVNLDGFSHVEDKDLVSTAHCGCLHHKAAGLWDGHEETGDLRMSDSQRTTGSNLGAETRNHRSV